MVSFSSAPAQESNADPKKQGRKKFSPEKGAHEKSFEFERRRGSSAYRTRFIVLASRRRSSERRISYAGPPRPKSSKMGKRPLERISV